MPANPNEQWAWMILDTLVAAGVSELVLSPGSRSTPIAVVADAHPRMQLSVHIDERSAGFYALGLAKASGRPVALVCTSGTAGAHYYPALIEARLTRVPLIALTADRPGSVQSLGAAQTVDQVHLYGRHVCQFLDLPLPGVSERALKRASLQVSLAAGACVDGPVHINVPFDVGDDGALVDLPPVGRGDWCEGWVAQVHDNSAVAGYAASVKDLVQWCLTAQRPLIVAGPDACHGEALVSLARALCAPLVADVASRVRDAHASDAPITHADAFVRHSQWPDADLVLRVGAWPTGKGVFTYLARSSATQVLIQPHLLGQDPEATLDAVIVGHVPAIVSQVVQLLAERGYQPDPTWRDRWVAAERHVTERLASAPETVPEEAQAVRAALAALDAEACVVWASSLPIRHGETYGGCETTRHASLAFRGANGIDGLLSATAGVARGSDRPVMLVVGDIAFLHDVGGLAAIARSARRIIILLLNNGGGGIFDQLPVAHAVPGYERLFATPQAVSFAHLAHAYGLHHHRVTAPQAVTDVMQAIRQEVSLTHHVIEVCTSRAETARMHTAWLTAITGTMPVGVLG